MYGCKRVLREILDVNSWDIYCTVLYNQIWYLKPFSYNSSFCCFCRIGLCDHSLVLNVKKLGICI